MLSWHIVETHSREENKANFNLTRQEFETFLPMFGRVAMVKSVRKVNLTALFPGYMFVRFDHESMPWFRVRNTLGVKSLLMTGSAPAVLKDDVIDGIKGRTDKFGVMMENEFDEWLVDRQLRIESGPFTGLIGQCVYQDKNRVKILLAILGRNIVTTIPRTQAVVAD